MTAWSLPSLGALSLLLAFSSTPALTLCWSCDLDLTATVAALLVSRGACRGAMPRVGDVDSSRQSCACNTFLVYILRAVRPFGTAIAYSPYIYSVRPAQAFRYNVAHDTCVPVDSTYHGTQTPHKKIPQVQTPAS